MQIFIVKYVHPFDGESLVNSNGVIPGVPHQDQANELENGATVTSKTSSGAYYTLTTVNV